MHPRAAIAGFWIGHTDRERGFTAAIGAGSVGAVGNVAKLVEAGVGKPALTRRVSQSRVLRRADVCTLQS
jgi:hypothetical protein